MITKYFKANVEDAVRIAVVEAEDADAMSDVPEAQNDREIKQSDLPEGFADWKRYTAHAYRGASVHVMSRDGD